MANAMHAEPPVDESILNPAMLLVGAIKPLRAVCLFLSQMIGAIAASAMVLGVFPAKVNVRTTLSSSTSLVRGVFIEAFLTAELQFKDTTLREEVMGNPILRPRLAIPRNTLNKN